MFCLGFGVSGFSVGGWWAVAQFRINVQDLGVGLDST